MSADRGRQGIIAVIGVSTGLVATGVWAWWRRARPPQAGSPPAQPRGAAGDVMDAMQRDPKLARRRIDVEAIADGVVELRGEVADHAEAERAMGVAQATRGVYTVVNRLRLADEEGRRETARRRWSDGAPDLHESHHYGMGVGMGRRRQSPATDPDRPSDRQRLLERELDVAKVSDDQESLVQPVSGDEAVESEDVKPGDEASIRDAGLDPRPHPNSTPGRSVEPQEPGEGG